MKSFGQGNFYIAPTAMQSGWVWSGHETMEQPGVQLTSSEDEETQAVLFKVRVAGLRKNEEVRVSGNTESLGRWDVHNSVSLKRQSE